MEEQGEGEEGHDADYGDHGDVECLLVLLHVRTPGGLLLCLLP